MCQTNAFALQTSDLDPTPVENDSAFFSSPSGRCLLRCHFAYLGLSDQLVTVLLWGHITASDINELIASFDAAASRGVTRDLLIQMNNVEAFEEEALLLLSRYFMAQSSSHLLAFKRQSIVRPAGSLGMLVTGFFSVVADSVPSRVFEKRGDALRWLDSGAELDVASDRLLARARSNDDIVYRLREMLAADPRACSSKCAADRLRTSTRTLQRRLSEAGTTFEAELKRARLAAAKTLLLRGTAPIKAVAIAVGLPSGERLSQIFRELEGVTPGDWRAQSRAEQP